MSTDPQPAWRTLAFRNRGTLLALPAIGLTFFGRPTAKSAAVGVPLALAGEALRCWAVGYSGVTTRADHVVAPRLVTAGPYAYTRNPLYVGNFITAVGFTVAFTGGLAAPRRTLVAAACLGTMLGVYAAIVPLEEAYLERTFGDDFREYVAAVPRIIPSLDARGSQEGTYDAQVIMKAETRTFITFGAMLLSLAGRIIGTK